MMNKVKLVSDIMKTMKSKENVTGILKAELNGPDLEVNVKKKFDADDMQAHHGRGCRGRGHGHGPHGHMMKMHRMQMMENGSINKDSDEFKKMKDEMKKQGRSSNWRDKMSMMSTALDLFNSIKVEELEDGNLSMTLSKDELSDELVERIHEGMERKHKVMHHRHAKMAQIHGGRCEGHGEFHSSNDFQKHIHEMKNPSVRMQWIVNEKREVIKGEINLSGETPKGKATLDASLDFDQ